MSEIYFPDIPKIEPPGTERVKKGDKIDPRKKRKEKNYQKGKHSPFSPKKIDENDNGEKSGRELDIVVAPEVEHTISEIEKSKNRLEIMSKQIIEKGWNSYQDWSKELLLLESELRMWQNGINKLDSDTKKQHALFTMIQFRNQLRTFVEMFTDNMLFLQGVAAILSKDNSQYDVTGKPTRGLSMQKAFQINRNG